MAGRMLRRLACSLALIAVIALVDGCEARRSSVRQARSGPTISKGAAPEAAPSTSGPEAEAAASSSQPHAEGIAQPTGFAKVSKAELPGLEWVRYEVLNEPSSEHPSGTVVALGYEHKTPWLVELDVATALPIARHPLPPEANDAGGPIEIVATDGALELAIQREDAIEWIGYDRSLVERRRWVLARMGTRGLPGGLSGFGVVKGHAVVVSHDAQAYVFDERGRRIAHHDCRPLSFITYGKARLVYANGLTVVTGLVGSHFEPALCAFGPDGTGLTRTRSYGLTDDLFLLREALYLDASHAIRALDSSLRPVGPPVADPRQQLRAAHCPVTGDVLEHDEWVWGIDVVLVKWCCGGEPGGLFFCTPRKGDRVPPTGTPGRL